MSAYLNKYNYDNVFQRNVIVGVIDVLHQKISYTSIISNKESFDVKIPFYYSFTGDERLLYDEFLQKDICKDGKIESNYDKIPRGILSYTGFNIESSSQVNPHVFGKYTKVIEDDNGNPNEMKTFYSGMRSIPITMTFDCKIMISTNIDMFKISENLIKLFYKNTTFSVDYNDVRVPCKLVMPESITQEKLFEFGYNDIKTISIDFSFEVGTFIVDFYGDSYSNATRMKDIIHTTDGLDKEL